MAEEAYKIHCMINLLTINQLSIIMYLHVVQYILVSTNLQVVSGIR